MKFIRGGRASGKTTLLIRQSAETGIPILTTKHCMVRWYKDYAKDIGLEIPEPILWCKWKIEPRKKVLIDNGEETINDILMQTCGVTCETMVIENPIEHLNRRR